MKTKEQVVKTCAQAMGFHDTQTKKSDRLDFKEVAVWMAVAALELAYEEGRAAALSSLMPKTAAPDAPDRHAG